VARKLSRVLASAVRVAGRLPASIPEATARKIDRWFERELTASGFAPVARRALSQITPGAAAQAASLRAFVEQVEYNGRRLAKMNFDPARVLSLYDAYAKRLPRGADWDRLRLCVALALGESFYRVREDEARAFFQLAEAESAADTADALIVRFLRIVGRAIRARRGRWRWRESAAAKGPARPRYVESGENCSWIVPILCDGKAVAYAEFDFAGHYPWLPRELQLIQTAAEPCLALAERARLVADLRAKEQKIRALAAHTLQVEENERRRIGRELHDETGQSMMLIRLQLEMLENQLAGHPLHERVRDVRDVTERTIQEIRRVIAALSPAALARFGLLAALRRTAADLRQNGLRVELALPDRLAPLTAVSEIALYRVAQECCCNILKHASATNVKIRLRSADTFIELTVEDDGIGFDPAAAARKPNAFGLNGIAERVELVGGRVRMVSRVGRGASIAVKLPLIKENHIVENSHSSGR
jgi:signal transduction histidine kinase